MTVTINGTQYDEQTVAEVESAGIPVRQLAQSRSVGGGTRIRTPGDLQAAFGQQYGGDRDIWDTLGYDKDVEADDYRAKYRRQDIARRIVELPAKDTWRRPPIVRDVSDADGDPGSQFEKNVDQLLNSRLNAYARRVDIAAGIGEFALLFIGVADDADSLTEPVGEGSLSGLDDIAYFAVFPQDQVEGWDLGKDLGRDPTDERYNRPVEYEIDFGDLDGDTTDDDIEEVHWSRIIHIAENPVESDLKGTPRLRPVYNRLEDLEKVVGASAEMFWSGADRKFQFDVRDGYADLPQDEKDALDDEAQKLVHDLQPYIKTQGMDINVMGGEEVDPSGVVGAILKFVSGATGIPQRKLVGSERGEQASTQDRANWFDQVASRQHNFAEPQILRATLDRLDTFGALPDPQGGTYDVEWEDLFETTELEQSKIEKNRAAAVKHATGGSPDMLPGGLERALEIVESGSYTESDAAAAESPPPDETDPEVQRQFRQQYGLQD